MEFKRISSRREGDIFECEEFHQYLESLEGTQSVTSAMDLGCGIPTQLFQLRVYEGFNKLIGIDIQPTEQELVQRIISKNKQDQSLYGKCKTLQECYGAYLNPLLNKGIIEYAAAQYTFRNFSNDFEFRLGRDLIELEFGKEQMNIIFAINSLHFIEFSARREILFKVAKTLSPNGVFAFEVNHEKNPMFSESGDLKKIGERTLEYKDGEIQYLYSEKEFLETISILQNNGIKLMKQPMKYYRPDNQEPTSMIFFGQKVEKNTN